MAKVKVRTVGKIITEKLSASKSQVEAYKKALGESVVTEIKQFIARGQSPVLDEGRFAPYKDKKKYPGDLKASKPVNLYLSGDMVNAIGFKKNDGSSISVGLMTGDSEILKRAKTHQEGTEFVAKRKFIPDGEGDSFAVKIQRTIRNIQETFIDDLIKKLNQ